jgi:REP element-mobilizing transposase RayT/DNA-binding MarR family transcriptional regulator
MPRKPRINIAGYHHVLNRGVAQTDVFLEAVDYETFLNIVCKACRAYKGIIHDYCLMPNHYHLLLETELDNLSLLMKQIDSNYAIYFNRKNERKGHLWQGRFTSRYITTEKYLYTLIHYIEYNPVEANLSEKVGAYPYTLYGSLLRGLKPVSCAFGSILLKHANHEGLQDLLGSMLSEKERLILKEIQEMKVIKVKDERRQAYKKKLSEHFSSVTNKPERNAAIMMALEDGYTQAEIAKYLGLSRSAISKIVKK